MGVENAGERSVYPGDLTWFRDIVDFKEKILLKTKFAYIHTEACYLATVDSLST